MANQMENTTLERASAGGAAKLRREGVFEKVRQFGYKGLLGFLLVFAGIVGIFSLLFWSVGGGSEQVRDDFVRDFLFSAVGAATTFGVTLISAGEKAMRDRNIRTNEIIAHITSGVLKGKRNKGSEGDFDGPRIVEQVVEFSHDRVRRSLSRELFAVTRTKLVAAQARWKDTFEKLAQCRDFHAAWNLYFVLHEDIRDSIKSMEELGEEIARLEGSTNKAKAAKENARVPGASHLGIEKLQKALRPLRAAIARRDESYALIPSLETFLGQQRTNGNEVAMDGSDWIATYRKLASFWALFDIISTDMRNAYRHLYEGIAEREGGSRQPHNVEFCRNTLGACLERVRNALAIISNSISRGDAGNNAVLSHEDDRNTIITQEDLKALVDHAKRIERGSDKSEHVPANFGVMIRDLYTAYNHLNDV